MISHQDKYETAASYLYFIEKTATNYSAYSPDLPGCVATGASREEAEQQMHEAIAFHVEGMAEDGLSIPKGQSSASWVLV